MRIAYLCSDPGVPVDGSKGASIHVREMTRAFASLGHQVLLLAARGSSTHRGVPGRVLPGTVVTHVVPADPNDDVVRRAVRDDGSADAGIAWTVSALLGAASFRTRSRRSLETFRPDLIYERHSLYGTTGVSLAEALGAPLVLEINAPLSEEQSAHRGLALVDATRQLEEMVLRAADRVVAVSPPLGRWAMERGVSPERVAVLPNGVDPARFRTPGSAGHEVRRELGLGDGPVIGFVGTLKPWHDVRGLLDAVARLHASGRRVRLLVVGEGPERASLEQRAAALGISPWTTFTGVVHHDRVPAYLAAMDVAVAPYAADGPAYFSPLKLFEYLAAALPVVAADIAGTRPCLDATGGWSYLPGDGAALARAVDEALSSPARREIGAAGRAHVVEQHTWSGTARAVLSLVADRGDLAAGRPATSPAHVA